MRKLIGLMFAVMVFMLPGMAVKAETVDYLNANVSTDNVVTFETKNADCTIVENNDSNNNVVWESGWYAVKSDIEINSRIIINNGEVNLILCDRAKLTAKKGITVSPGNTINIHGQSGGTGKLYAGTTDGTGVTVQENYAGIGGELEGCGTITINGGNVTANGNGAGIGIGGDRNGGTGGNITINGGTVTVKGGNSSAGIGGGNNGSGGTIAINGGIVTAIGGSQAAGIGGGNNGSGGTITINGGIVTANGGIDAQGIGNGANYSGNGTNTLTLGSGVNMYISDNNSYRDGFISGTGNTYNGDRKRFMKVLPPVPYMTWNGNKIAVADSPCTLYYPAIGITNYLNSGWFVVNQNVTVSERITVSGTVNLILCDGCTLTAKKGITVNSPNTLNIYAQSGGTGMLSAGTTKDNGMPINCAGIGGASGNCGTITINGGNVIAIGGDDGSGIGGGDNGAGGKITINGGTVTATGSQLGAGIGGGDKGVGGKITINDGTVTATGGSYGAGIGGGDNGAGGQIVITDGTVTANGGSHAAGIGGGDNSVGEEITIRDGFVTATGGDGGAGIGGGSDADGGKIIINGGFVTAYGSIDNVGRGGAGIGGGGSIEGRPDGAGGEITINGGTVIATGGTGAEGIGHGTNSNDSGTLTIGEDVKVYSSESAFDVPNEEDLLTPDNNQITQGRQQFMKAITFINRIDLTITKPAIGTVVTINEEEKQIPTPVVSCPANSKYTIEAEWINGDGTPFEGTIQAGTYTAKIMVLPNTGFVISNSVKIYEGSKDITDYSDGPDSDGIIDLIISVVVSAPVPPSPDPAPTPDPSPTPEPKKPSTVTAADQTFEYNKVAVSIPSSAITVTGSSATPTVKYYDTDKKEISAPVNAGSYFYKAFVAEDENYLGAESDYANLTITKAKTTVYITSCPTNVTYHVKKQTKLKKNKSFIVEAITNNGKPVSYSINTPSKKIKIDSVTGKVTVGQGLKKGTYKVKVKAAFSGEQNYEAGAVMAEITIKVKK